MSVKVISKLRKPMPNSNQYESYIEMKWIGSQIPSETDVYYWTNSPPYQRFDLPSKNEWNFLAKSSGFSHERDSNSTGEMMKYGRDSHWLRLFTKLPYVGEQEKCITWDIRFDGVRGKMTDYSERNLVEAPVV